MPIDYKEYHPKWSLISKLIRYKRANNCCEKCGLPNGGIIKRLGKDRWREPNPYEWKRFKVFRENLKFSRSSAIKAAGLTNVVLTVAHIDHDKTNNRFSNLAAWCQSCHLHHDLNHHITNRKYGRNWKKNQLNLNL